MPPGGYNEFIICAGFKQHVIKECLRIISCIHRISLLIIQNGNNEMIVHNKHTEPWKVTVVDTGPNTQTGGRVKRIREYIGDEPLCLPTEMQ